MDIYQKISSLRQENKNFVVVTIVKSTGSTPGKPGFKMVVDSEGTSYGTVGGGAIEKEAVQESMRILQSGEGNILKEYLLNKDEKIVKEDITVLPMSCCGKATVFYELDRNTTTLYIFGGGHVGSALVSMAQHLKFNIVVIDNRSEVIEKCKVFPVQCIHSEYKEYAEKFNPNADSYFVVVTYGHTFDYEVLKTLYARNLVSKYIGVIASKNKAKEMIQSLKTDIAPGIDLSLLHTPIGIKFGGDTAHEIALSIAAEIQAVKYGKKVSVEG